MINNLPKQVGESSLRARRMWTFFWNERFYVDFGGSR